MGGLNIEKPLYIQLDLRIKSVELNSFSESVIQKFCCIEHIVYINIPMMPVIKRAFTVPEEIDVHRKNF